MTDPEPATHFGYDLVHEDSPRPDRPGTSATPSAGPPSGLARMTTAGGPGLRRRPRLLTRRAPRGPAWTRSRAWNRTVESISTSSCWLASPRTSGSDGCGAAGGGTPRRGHPAVEPSVAAHVARHDPARVLLECSANGERSWHAATRARTCPSSGSGRTAWPLPPLPTQRAPVGRARPGPARAALRRPPRVPAGVAALSARAQVDQPAIRRALVKLPMESIAGDLDRHARRSRRAPSGRCRCTCRRG